MLFLRLCPEESQAENSLFPEVVSAGKALDRANGERCVGESPRWSNQLDTGCGIQAFSRPCQVPQKTAASGIPYPQNPICKVHGETVYIVDDDKDLLEELKELVEWCGYSVRTFANPLEFQSEPVESLIGCVMLDLELPGADGMEIQSWLKLVAPDLPIIYISGTASVDTAVSCMRAGAVEFLSKPIRNSEMRRALNSAMGVMRKRHCRRLAVNDCATRVARLTPAERRVAELIAQGYVTKQVADLLGRSENTTKIHRFRIFNKLGVSSSASIVKIMEMANEANVRHVEGLMQTG